MENESHHSHAHGSMVHEPAAGMRAGYERVYDEARPARERQIITVELDARELDWEFVQGQYYRAWEYASQVPGPVVNACVGSLPHPRAPRGRDDGAL